MRQWRWLIVVSLTSPSIAFADNGIVTERPSFVDSSETVDIQNLQIETGVQDAHDRGSVNDWTLPTLLRWGVARDWELRFESDVFERSDGQRQRYVDSWSNMIVGVKQHVGGDSGDGPSSAWFAEVELPTGAAGSRGQGVRPSARWVTEWNLPADYSFGVMPGVKYDSGDNGRFLSGSLGAVLGKNLSDASQVFVEIAAPQIARNEHGGTQLSFDTGVQYRIAENFQIDAAVFLGLNDRTPDATFTVGMSAKW